MSLDDNDYDARPETPPETECCGNGCNFCILDVHRKLVEEWERRNLENIKISIQYNLLAAAKYTTFVVGDITNTCDDCILIRLEYKGNTVNGTRLFLSPGQYVMLRVSTISRPLTPISWTNNSLLFLAKLYQEGNFSHYLKQLNVGDEIDVRGPYGEFVYEPNSFKEIVMFSIGSGIATLYPIAKSIIDTESEETRIYLVAGFRSYSHIPLKKELRDLSDYWNFNCTLQISQDDDEVTLSGIEVRKGRLEKKIAFQLLNSHSPETTLVLICGTTEFNESVEQWIKELNYLYFYVFK